MKYFIFALVFIVASVVADSPPPPAYKPAPPPPAYKPAPAYKEPAYGPVSYSYDWAVKDDYSGNNYGQTETRNDKSTVGSYYVALPDGRTQKVSYTVDAYGGYVAEVTYEGEAKYPEYKPAPASKPAPAPPAYKPAPPPPAPAPAYKPAPAPPAYRYY